MRSSFEVNKSNKATEKLKKKLIHYAQTQIGPQTHAIIGGTMVSRSGMGGGNILGTVRHTVSPKLWGEVSILYCELRVNF